MPLRMKLSEPLTVRRGYLDEGTLLICDAKGPQALAGIMGGAGSEVTTGTTDIVLEAACFEATAIRRTSRKIGLSTDSSFIFERGLDIEGVESALDRAAYLIKEFLWRYGANRSR